MPLGGPWAFHQGPQCIEAIPTEPHPGPAPTLLPPKQDGVGVRDKGCLGDFGLWRHSLSLRESKRSENLYFYFCFFCYTRNYNYETVRLQGRLREKVCEPVVDECVCVHVCGLCMHAQSLSHVRLFETLGIIACQSPLSAGFPGKNTGVGCHFFLQEIFTTQGSYPRLLHWQMDSLPLSHLGFPLCMVKWMLVRKKEFLLNISQSFFGNFKLLTLKVLYT